MARTRPWRTPQLPELVGAKEAAEILGIPRMGLHRWLEPGSGTLGPDRTYMVPPKRINAGPVWVREDIERFKVEVGRKNPAYGSLADKPSPPPRQERPPAPLADVLLPVDPFREWLQQRVDGDESVAKVARGIGMREGAVRAVLAGERKKMHLSAIQRALQLAGDGRKLEVLYPELADS